MIPTGISEFTFGYAFLYEQTHANWANLVAAPVLPSLQQEADGGWDAHLPVLGTDFYYQFKLADHLFNWNAKYIADGTYHAAYYRLSLHKRDRNRQHRRLRAHCARHPETYYVAPEFSGLGAFNQSFLARQIAQRSRLIPLTRCPDITDSDQHYITYQQGNPAWIQHSEPKRDETSYSGATTEALYRRTEPTWRDIDEAFAISLFERVVADVERVARDEERGASAEIGDLLDAGADDRSRAGYLRRTADLLSIFYGLTMVMVGMPGARLASRESVRADV